MVTQRSDGSMEFRFFRPQANQVNLAGEFNGWHKHSFAMTRMDDGWWQYRIHLAPGVYQFRYVADGEWFTDYAAFGLERNHLGWNSVAKVDPVRVVKPSKPRTQPKIRPRQLTADLAEILDRSKPQIRTQEPIFTDLDAILAAT
jgi:1,4-alpha-glucan branching enzyme